MPIRIYTTQEWGADPVAIQFAQNAALGIVIHNTQGANRPPKATVAEEERAAFSDARSIQDFHRRSRSQGGNGWSDSGQNFLISQGGLILECRHASAGAAQRGLVVRGAHASGVTHYNQHYFGIEVAGDFAPRTALPLRSGMHSWGFAQRWFIGAGAVRRRSCRTYRSSRGIPTVRAGFMSGSTS